MHFSAPREGRQKSTRSPAGQTNRPHKAAVSIGFYSANPKPAKQVLSKLDAEMRFETPPPYFQSVEGCHFGLVLPARVFKHISKKRCLAKNVLKTRATAMLNFGVLDNVRLAAARMQIDVFLWFFIFDDTHSEICTV